MCSDSGLLWLRGSCHISLQGVLMEEIFDGEDGIDVCQKGWEQPYGEGVIAHLSQPGLESDTSIRGGMLFPRYLACARHILPVFKPTKPSTV